LFTRHFLIYFFNGGSPWSLGGPFLFNNVPFSQCVFFDFLFYRSCDPDDRTFCHSLRRWCTPFYFPSLHISVGRCLHSRPSVMILSFLPAFCSTSSHPPAPMADGPPLGIPHDASIVSRLIRLFFTVGLRPSSYHVPLLVLQPPP